MRPFKPIVVAVSLGACSFGSNDASPPSPSESQVAQELNGMEGMFEFAIDIPWRIEPNLQPDGTRRYDPVPITIAIHDEDTNPLSISPVTPGVSPGDGRLWNFCKLEVSRYRNGLPSGTQTFLPNQLAWIERTGRAPGAPASQATYWPTVSQGLTPPSTTACYPSRGDCTGHTLIHDTSEWHALLKWDPGVPLPNTSETLQLVAYVSAFENCTSSQIRLTNYARTHWAADPLPRFDDDRWLYGDLHYHSQSTDNEGESGYAYRAVAAALGALGVDFVFATDHASDSEQIVDVDVSLLELLSETVRGLRDLSDLRWNAAQTLLHGVAGANADIAGSWPQDRNRVPRMFLGAEVDITPEVGLAPTTFTPGSGYWVYSYGDNRVFDIEKWAKDHTLSDKEFSAADIPAIFQPFIDHRGFPAYMLGEAQGLDDINVGRQHLLHLPRFAEQPTGFVASKTGRYGGATRHALEGSTSGSGILPEIGSKQGVAFLAHPLAAGGAGSGPGIAPYSGYQYQKMFDQQTLVGLQLWNEDARVSSSYDAGDYDVTGYNWLGATSSGNHIAGWSNRSYRFSPMYDLARWGWQKIHFDVDQALHNGAHVWDQLLRWGLDQGRTASISWLAPGEPRRLFMAGGSDAHGDWSYRREGYLTETSATNDTAIAKVRNLVFAGRARTGCRPTDTTCIDPVAPEAQSSHDQATVADALAEGRFSVTDGPALRLVVDRNRNGIIDDTDYPMGSVVDLYGAEAFPIIAEWHSTPEFGMVDRIDFYVGVDADPQCVGECLNPINESRARTYAPADHGARRDLDETADLVRGSTSGSYIADPPATECAGRCRMQDGYWLPTEGAARQNLRYLPSQAESYRGTRVLQFNLDDYPSSGTISPRATRAYVRAFARTYRGCDAKNPNTADTLRFSGQCSPRYAFANPVWALRKPAPSSGCPTSDRSLDRDLDHLPDLCDPAPAAGQAPSWTRHLGGTGYDSVAASAFDASGNLYVAASTAGAGRIERGKSAQTPFSGLGNDAHVLKYNREGQLVGRFQVMGQGTATITDVATDSSGNVYLSGSFTGTTIFGSTTVSSADSDSFVLKLSGSDLSVAWARFLTGAGASVGTGLAVTADGHVVALGHFHGTMQTGSSTLVSDGAEYDCYMLWLDRTSGSQRAVQRFGGTGGCYAQNVVADSQSRTYAAVNYTGRVQLGFNSKTTTSSDAMVARFGSALEMGTPSWAAWIGDPSQSDAGQVNDVKLLPNEDLVIAGQFTGTLRVGFDASALTTVGTSAGGYDGFVLKLARANGAAIVPPSWRIGGTGDDMLSALATDGLGRILATGRYISTSIATAVGTVTRSGTSDGLVLFYNSAHQLQSISDFGTVSSASGATAAFSSDGRMAFGGATSSPPSAGAQDGFVTSQRAP